MGEAEDRKFADVALAAGLVESAQVQEVLRVIKETRDARSLGRLLVAHGLITELQRRAVAELLRIVADPHGDPLPHPGSPGESNVGAASGELPAAPAPAALPADVDTSVAGHPFGRLILQRGLATSAQVKECLEEQRRLSGEGQPKQLGEIMVDRKYLTVTQVRDLLGQQDKEILRCEKCGAKYNVTKMAAGKTVRCLKCGAGLVVPAKLSSAGVDASLQFHGSTDPLIGKVLGGCRIEQKLGQGGMATVYKGMHLGLNKMMAVKILPPSSAANRDFIDRFVREARAAAKIEHANIVQVFNVGCEQGFNFITMQFVQGRTLTEVLAETGSLPAERTQGIITEVAKGLAIAHKHGIVHRDVKPDNILVMEDGKIKISDFGLAQEVKNPKGNKADMIAGTPYYMPPEQWEGKPVDARSDLYALGVTYYFLLSGHKPFAATDVIVLMRMHARDEPPHPKKWGTSLDEGTWAVIRKMLAKKPEDRYQTAEELLKDLERIRQGLEPLAMTTFSGKSVECSFCNALNAATARRCTVCGEGLGEAASAELELGLRDDEFYCPKCKAPNERGAESCGDCHALFCRDCQEALAVARGRCRECAANSPPDDHGPQRRVRR